MADTKRKIKSWQFNVAAITVLLLAFFGYAIVAHIGASSGTVIPYYPADCSDTSMTQSLTDSDVKAFVIAYRNGGRATLTLDLSCGGSSPSSGEYAVKNRLTASNRSIRDSITYSASASPNSTAATVCSISYSSSDDDQMGDRFVLLDCARMTAKLSYSGPLSP